jgi:hypothetical protein
MAVHAVTVAGQSREGYPPLRAVAGVVSEPKFTEDPHLRHLSFTADVDLL